MNAHSWNPLPAWQTACLLLISFTVYALTLRAGFVYDDISITVLKNPFLHCEVSAWDVLMWDRPLREFTYWFDHALWGFNPLGYHLQNMLWHTANCWLMVVLLTTMRMEANAAFWCALLFAVHPINTEAVAWVSGRKDLLCLFFELLACIWFLQAYQTKTIRWLYAGSCLAFVLALLSKQVAIVLPGLLLLCVGFHHIQLKQKIEWKPLLYYWFPFALIAVFSLIFYFDIFTILGIVEERGTFYDPSANEVEYTTLSALLTPFATFFKSWKYLTVPDMLVIDREFAPVVSLLDWRWLAGLFCLALYLYVFLKEWKLYPAILFGLFWWLIAWFPLSGIVPIGYLMADRYLYIPNIGFCVCIVALFSAASQQNPARLPYPPKTVFLTVMVIIISLFSIRTVYRTLDWQNELTLWQSALSYYPNNPSIYFNIGNYYWDNNQLDEAKHYWEKAIELDPVYEEVWLNMGIAAKDAGMPDEAEAHYRRALEINQDYGNAHYNLALLLEEKTDPAGALPHFQQAAKFLFGKRNAAQLQAVACYHSARLLHQQGNAEQALAYIKRGLSLSQHHAPSFVLYGMLMNHNPETARQAFLRAIALSPNYAAAHYNLGVLEWMQGNRSEADQHWNVAVSLDATLQTQIDQLKQP